MKKKAKRRKARSRARARGRVSVSHAAFCKAWKKAYSVADVAAKVHMAYSGAQARALVLRKAGVKLPKFTRKARRIDVAALNAILRGRA